MCQNFMILQNSDEDSKIISFRNRNHVFYPEIYQKEQIEKIDSVEIPQNTLSQQYTQLSYAQFSDRSKNTILIDQLKKQLSNQKHQNLPRQINSGFNDYEELKISKKYNFVSQDQSYKKIIEKEDTQIGLVIQQTNKNYNLPKPSTFNNQIKQVKDIPKKSLKQAIYERLLNEKLSMKCNIIKNPSVIKQNFKSQKSTQIKNNSAKSTQNSKIKTIIKQKLAQNIPKLQLVYEKNSEKYKQISKKQKMYLSIINNQHHHSSKNVSSPIKYKTLLKNSSKQNFNALNKINTLQFKNNNKFITGSKAQSYVDSLKLRQKKANQVIFFEQSKVCNEQKVLNNKEYNLSKLPFHERQSRLLDSKTEKILRYSEQKKIAQMQQCTFRPKFTKYKKQRSSPKNHYKSYAQLYKKKTNKIL